MAYVKLCEKNPLRHGDPAKRLRIVKAMLKDQIGDKPTSGQRMLIETVAPIYLRLLEMQKNIGTPDFDFAAYAKLQETFRVNLGQLNMPSARQARDKANRPEFDLCGALKRA